MIDVADIKLVIWDLDGTLIDSFGVYQAIITEAAQLSGLTVPTEASMRHNFHGSLDQTVKDTMGLVEGETLTKLLNDFLRVQEAYYRQPEDHVYTDALHLMKRLADPERKQIVVTNRAHAGRGNASPRYLVENTEFKQYISDIVCGDDVTSPKPDPAVITGITAIQNVAGNQILVIGDQFVDAQLALNLKARAIIVNRSDYDVPHLEKLGQDRDFLQIVASLDDV